MGKRLVSHFVNMLYIGTVLIVSTVLVPAFLNLFSIKRLTNFCKGYRAITYSYIG